MNASPTLTAARMKEVRTRLLDASLKWLDVSLCGGHRCILDCMPDLQIAGKLSRGRRSHLVSGISNKVNTVLTIAGKVNEYSTTLDQGARAQAL